MINIYDIIKCNNKHPKPNNERFVVIHLDFISKDHEFNIVHFVNIKDIKKYNDKKTDLADVLMMQKSDYLDRYELDVNYYRKKKIKKLLDEIRNS